MPPEPRTDFWPGLVGQLVALHGTYYADRQGFATWFEAEVAAELGRFALDFDPAVDGIWSYEDEGRLLGAVALDGHHPPAEGARLRWFIVDPSARGAGLGKRLVARALAFARATGQPRVHLWTVAGLEAARRVYLGAGFCLVEDQPPASIWGKTLRAQRYCLDWEAK